MIVCFAVSLPSSFLKELGDKGCRPSEWWLLTYMDDSYLKRAVRRVCRIDSEIKALIGNNITTFMIEINCYKGENVFKYFRRELLPKLEKLIKDEKEKEKLRKYLESPFVLVLSEDVSSSPEENVPSSLVTFTQSVWLPQQKPAVKTYGNMRIEIFPNALILREVNVMDTTKDTFKIKDALKTVILALSRIYVEINQLNEKIEELEEKMSETKEIGKIEETSVELSRSSRLLWEYTGAIFTDPVLSEVYDSSLEVMGIKTAVEKIKERLDILWDALTSIVSISIDRGILEIEQSSDSLQQSLLGLNIAIMVVTLFSSLSAVISLFQMANLTLSLWQAIILTIIISVVIFITYIYIYKRLQKAKNSAKTPPSNRGI